MQFATVAGREDLAANPQLLHSNEALVYFDVGEEASTLQDLVRYELAVGKDRHRPRFLLDQLRKKIRSRTFEYWHNSSNPSMSSQEFYRHSWSAYDWYIGYQTPRPLGEPKIHYHSQNRIAKPHRTQLVKALWNMDKFAHGTVSYTQDKTAEWKDYADPQPPGGDTWQENVLGWLPSADLDMDLVPEMCNNPPPPLDYWENAAVNITTETIITYANLTEKTWSNTIWARPWIGVGGAGLHELYSSQGYELLPHIDYAFDALPFTMDRVRGVVDNVKNLLDNDPLEVYNSFKPTVERNRLELLKKIALTPLPDLLHKDGYQWMPAAELMRQTVFKARGQAQQLLEDYPNIGW
jgi:hypothetical protein